jgi:hypothetical protein
VRTEAALVGVAAMTFATRFDLPGVSRLPTPGRDGRVHRRVRGRPTDAPKPGERQQIAACATLLAAYAARCEHCAIAGYDAEADQDSFTAALRAHGQRYLQIQ